MQAEKQLEQFLEKYTPAIAAIAKEARSKMRSRVPGALELVYDNYNALVIGYAPSERASEAIFSIALYPKWVNLFFLQGSGLTDPAKRLKGSGSTVRSIRLSSAADLDDPEVEALIAQALDKAKVPIDAAQPHRIVIRAVAEKQRPRRPVA